MIRVLQEAIGELNYVLKKRKPADPVLDTPNQKLKDILKDIESARIDTAMCEKVLEIIIESYRIIHDKYKDWKFYRTNGVEKKIFSINRSLNIMCETAVKLYSIFGSRFV